MTVQREGRDLRLWPRSGQNSGIVKIEGGRTYSSVSVC